VAEWFRQGPAKPRTAVRFRPPPPEVPGFSEGRIATFDVAASFLMRVIVRWSRAPGSRIRAQITPPAPGYQSFGGVA
jgi:hypothetical protein